MVPSGQCGEIGSSVGCDQVAQGRWGKHLDLIAPLVEVPGHFQVPGSVEADGQRAIGFLG